MAPKPRRCTVSSPPSETVPVAADDRFSVFQGSYSYVFSKVVLFCQMLTDEVGITFFGSPLLAYFHAGRCQFEPLRAFICGATVVVSGPRSFSKMTPLWVTTKVLTPDDRYSAGYAINFRPFLPLPRLLAPDMGSSVT